ncbi:hypothetical protein [Pyxidicoccus xibeiensis]|uniref:hypothetical protein n=1 Tax=Pyxidicoccus xibeiensis TaxID=2906759 RepID=UPI0020A79475|nr:hypothetical protein [Pyxidicoccus xibeiensis]MCP3142935.1 hypothetical protein [Pyxidicoccus xibeiensis]
MRAVQVVPLLLLLASTVSCSSAQTVEDPDKPPPPKTTVVVENQKTVDFNLYVLNGAGRVRLGTVPGMTRRTFTLPHHMIGTADRVRFGLEQIGTFGDDERIGTRRSYTSEEELPVRAGEEVSLSIK